MSVEKIGKNLTIFNAMTFINGTLVHPYTFYPQYDVLYEGKRISIAIDVPMKNVFIKSIHVPLQSYKIQLYILHSKHSPLHNKSYRLGLIYCPILLLTVYNNND